MIYERSIGGGTFSNGVRLSVSSSLAENKIYLGCAYFKHKDIEVLHDARLELTWWPHYLTLEF